MKLNTENPNCFTYTTDELLIELLGGVRIDTLDRMRVTIKVSVTKRKHPGYTGELADLAVRHNLDLYNDTQLEKFVRTVAERLEVGTIAIKKAIADITSQLEVYRLEQLSKKEARKEKVLSAKEREEAMQFLEQKNLLEATNLMIGRSGVIGEEVNRLLMYLIFTSRKREHSLHVISLGSSGIGKTYLQEKVGELIPSEDKVEITVLSENALYYFGKRELQHRLVMIEDLDKGIFKIDPSKDAPEAVILWDPFYPDEWYTLDNRIVSPGFDDLMSSGIAISWVNEKADYWIKYDTGGGVDWSPTVISAVRTHVPQNPFLKLALNTGLYYRRLDQAAAFRNGTVCLPRGDGNPSRFIISFYDNSPNGDGSNVIFEIM